MEHGNGSDEMILVPRAELLAWAKAWQDEYDPNDGADCVTPFDAYLLKSPVNAQSTVHVEVLRHMKGTIKAIMPSEVAALDAAIAALSAPQPPVEVHCATCSCVPGMTPAVRFDATPAEKEGAVRDHLIRMGWTPPAEAQPVGVEGFRDWVIEQMPAGTVIDNPELWAERLARAYELNVPPPSAPVGAGEVDCRCVDCGGNQPGHDPTCGYMHELHGEAQPVAWEWEYIGGDHYPRGHKVARSLREMDPTNPPYPETWRPTRPLIYGDTAPPSAPVGVPVDVVCEYLDARARYDLALRHPNSRHPNSPEGLRLREARNVLDSALRLAQQPAAAGEEVMVNTPYDVFTLPLQPSGLSSGPRFVVHVPGPEQPEGGAS